MLLLFRGSQASCYHGKKIQASVMLSSELSSGCKQGTRDSNPPRVTARSNSVDSTPIFLGGGVTKLTPVLAPPASTRDRFQEGAMLFGRLLPTSPPCPWLLEHGAAEQSRHREFRLVKDSHVCGRRGDFFLSSLKSVKEDICHPNICTFCGRQDIIIMAGFWGVPRGHSY